MRSGREAYGIGIAGPPDPGMGLWRSRLFAELASRDNSSLKALFVNRDQTAHGIGIARHPGPKIIESLTELASRAFFRGIGIAIKIDSRNWHREGNYPRNLASWKAFAELASQ